MSIRTFERFHSLLWLAAAAAAILVTSSSKAAPIRWTSASGGNDHFYELVDASVNWAEARTAAEGGSFLGATGNLVSITSLEENLFLTDHFGASSLEGHWIGLFQQPGSDEPAGGWIWTTGEQFSFSGWFPGEPNNSFGTEDRGIFAHPAQSFGKGWNDSTDGIANGYVVEYVVPEPTAISLLGLTVAVGLVVIRRRSTC